VQLETENTVIKGASLIAQSRDLLILNQWKKASCLISIHTRI
jgi:hypothetical protein